MTIANIYNTLKYLERHFMIGIESRTGNLMKNTEEIQKNLDIIEATVVNAINKNNVKEDKPVLGEV